MKCYDCHLFKGKVPVVRCEGKDHLVCNICAPKWAEYMPSLRRDA